MTKDLLIKGDCLQACKHLKDNNIKIDLVYIDPPFGISIDKQFGIDWSNMVYEEFDYINLIAQNLKLSPNIEFKTQYVYLNWLYKRLIAIKGTMSDNSSFYLHCDYHCSHYIKLILDNIFGLDNFRNEIIWYYQGSWIEPKTYFPRRHNSIFFYKKNNEDNSFNRLYENDADNQINSKRWKKYIVDNKIYANNMPTQDSRFKVYINKFTKENGREPINNDIVFEANGTVCGSVWNIKNVDPKSSESNGYPTQKPEALLERIIKSSSKEGDLVADFFCGSGTTLVVAEKLNRNYIGVDISDEAISKTKTRLLNPINEIIT